jgi:hypothetical protein
MESLLVRLMVLTALGELGFAAFGGGFCLSGSCLANTDKAARNILRIEWKPIPTFPYEVKRFR